MRPAPFRVWRAVALLAFLLMAMPARAGDGDLDWRTIETRHFRLHYPAGLDALAHRSARICEEARAVLVPLLGDFAPPERVEVSLLDFGDSANGSATALPYPRMTLLAAPPTLDGNLGDYDDWLRLLIFHEYTHILQLDRISGLPALINNVIGRVAAPVQAQPSFVLEGGAVYAESATSGRGRIHSAMFRGFLRAQALDGRLHGIDAITHAPIDWPGANVWYMYGGHFMDWIARTRGPQTIGGFYDETSDNLVPFGINRAAEVATGRTMDSLYQAWIADLTATARAEQAELVVAGLTPLRWRTTTGRRHAELRYLPDGTLLSQDGGAEPSGIYARRPDTPLDAHDALVLDGEGIGGYDVCRGGRAL
ncbi:MAG: hypothetical protein KC620_25190, partial [Myxococcales bacterium]|nr:hypothetical protein [Myxococcales bacterium]